MPVLRSIYIGLYTVYLVYIGSTVETVKIYWRYGGEDAGFFGDSGNCCSRCGRDMGEKHDHCREEWDLPSTTSDAHTVVSKGPPTALA